MSTKGRPHERLGLAAYGNTESGTIRDGCIVWRHQEGSQISTEVNAVVSLTDTGFRLREAGRVTTFQRRH